MQTTKPSSPVKASTQTFTEVAQIKDDIVIRKDHSGALVIEVGAANFWLLSQEEQMGMVGAYANLLNSLSFPVQILILSKKIDISSYLDYLGHKIDAQNEEIAKDRLKSYKDFIKGVVKTNTVLERKFYFVIPFAALELGPTAMRSASISNEYILSRAKTSLYPKRDNLLRLLAKMGLRAQVLDKQGLVELFYNLYNPSPNGRQLAKVENYTEVILTS